jgi:hypothetical protein
MKFAAVEPGFGNNLNAFWRFHSETKRAHPQMRNFICFTEQSGPSQGNIARTRIPLPRRAILPFRRMGAGPVMKSP